MTTFPLREARGSFDDPKDEAEVEVA